MNPTIRQPSFEEVIAAFEVIEKVDQTHPRTAERIQVVIPGEMRTQDGLSIPIRLRDLSHSGIGFFHYGTVELGEVVLKLAVHSYRVQLKWCVKCLDDLYMSGGPILRDWPSATRNDSTSSS